ncbi:MAG: RsmE family RNA methyltransferase [Flavobacteriaceae bacterium]
MQLFIHTEFSDSDQTIVFDQDESKHMIKVLRHQRGDRISVTNSRGIMAQGVIVDANAKGCEVALDQFQHFPPPAQNIHIAIAPTKQMERLEWFVEKATELGVTRITPVISSHSERKNLRLDRLEKRRDAALKQSLSAYGVQIDPLCRFETFINESRPNTNLYVAHCLRPIDEHLIQAPAPENDSVVLIGPEGDFSPEEVALAEKNGYRSISLGHRRLRTETAGIAAVQYLITKPFMSNV